jgi:hypothetical protein
MKINKILFFALLITLSINSNGQIPTRSTFINRVFITDSTFSNAHVIVKYKGTLVAEVYKKDSLVVYDSLLCIKALLNSALRRDVY